MAGCGRSDEERVSGHPPLVVLIDRIELIRAGTAEDPLDHLRRHGRRLEAPRFEGWFHDMAELYFQSKHRLSLGTDAPDVQATIRSLAERTSLWLSIYGYEDRGQAARVAAVETAEDDLRRFHTEFVRSNRLPGWPAKPDEVEVAGRAMQAWVRAYPRLIEQITPRTALVIAWDGDSSERVAELAGG